MQTQSYQMILRTLKMLTITPISYANAPPCSVLLTATCGPQVDIAAMHAQLLAGSELLTLEASIVGVVHVVICVIYALLAWTRVLRSCRTTENRPGLGRGIIDSIPGSVAVALGIAPGM